MPCGSRIWPPGSACSELCTRAPRTGTGLTATEGRCLMRVAVLADIHGNLPALEAVLCDIEAAGVDVIVLNGDIADGPMPRRPWTASKSWESELSGCAATPTGAWPRRSTARSGRRGCLLILPRNTSHGAPPGSDKGTGTGWLACR